MQLYFQKNISKEFVPIEEIINKYNRIILKILINNFILSDFESQKKIIAFLNKNLSHSVLSLFENVKYIDNVSLLVK